MASTAPLTATAVPVAGFGSAFRAVDSAPMASAAIARRVQKDLRACVVGCGVVAILGSHQVFGGGQEHGEDG